MAPKKTGFTRPTLKQLRDRAIAEVNSRIPESDALLRNSVLNVVTVILADLTNELYGYLDFIARQVFPDIAESEYLDQWGNVWGVTRKLASFASGKITVRGVSGSSLPAGTQYRRSDGVVYLTTESVITEGETQITVKSEKVGLNTNSSAGVKISLISPVAGIMSDAVVSANGLTGGTEREDDEPYRARILERIQEPPKGGSKTDYINWMLQVAGVTRAWTYPLEMGPGTVGLRFMMDNTYPDGIPQAGDIIRVYEYLNQPDRRPVTAEIFVTAPDPNPIDISISNLFPNTPEVQVSIQKELADFFIRETSPGCIVRVSKIWEAISIAIGTDHFKLISPDDDFMMDPGVIPILGDINFV